MNGLPELPNVTVSLKPRSKLRSPRLVRVDGKLVEADKRVGAVDVHVGVVHLLGQVMVAQNLVEFGEGAGLAIGGRLVEGFFAVQKELRRVGRWNEIELAVFVNALGRGEPKCFVLYHGPASGGVVIPAQQIGRLALPWNTGGGSLSRYVGTVKSAAAIVGRGQAMNVVAAGLGDYVDDSAGRVSELCFVSGGDDLEFCDGVLIKLRRWAAIQFVLIRKPVDQEAGVIGTLAQDRRRVVAVEVRLTIDGHSGNKLKQVKIVPPVDGHVADVLRENRRARRRRIRLEQRQLRGDVHDFVDSADLELQVKRKCTIDRDVQILEASLSRIRRESRRACRSPREDSGIGMRRLRPTPLSGSCRLRRRKASAALR